VLFGDPPELLLLSCCGEFTAGRWFLFRQQVRACRAGVACSRACSNDFLPSVEVIVCGFVSMFSSYSVQCACWTAQPLCVVYQFSRGFPLTCAATSECGVIMSASCVGSAAASWDIFLAC
jgi:hypothetical protein